jgi:hypothetical protein
MTDDKKTDRSGWSAADVLKATIEGLRAKAKDDRAKAKAMTLDPDRKRQEIRDYMSAVRKKTGPRPIMTEAVKEHYRNIGAAGGTKAGQNMTPAERQERTAKGNRMRWEKQRAAEARRAQQVKPAKEAPDDD